MNLRALLMLVLVFFSIYWVTLPFVSNSLFFLFFLLFAFSRGWLLVETARLFKDPVIFCFGVSIAVAILFTAVIATSSGSFDYSYTLLLLRQIPYLVAAIGIGAFVCRWFLRMGSKSRAIEDYLLTAGSVQGVIVLCALLYPEFRMAILPFQGSENPDFLLAEGNFGIRGMALAAQQFFGLAAMLSIQAAIIAGWAITHSKSRNSYFYVRFLIFGIACLLVGRTSGIFFIVLLVVIIGAESAKSKIYLILVMAAAAISVGLSVDTNDPLIAWAFEPLINFLNGDGFTSTSSANLTEDMLFKPTPTQILFGDGIYTASDGFYYKDTDSGVMRPLLFGGTALLLLLALPYVFATYSRSPQETYHPQRKLSVYIATAAILVLQVKGEVFLTATMPNVLLFFYLATIRSKT